MSEYWKDRSNKDGHANYCKTCATQKHLLYARAHKEKVNEYMRKRRSTEEGRKACRELTRASYLKHGADYNKRAYQKRKERLQADPVYRRKVQLVDSLSYFMHRDAPWTVDSRKTSGLDKLIECSPTYLREYLFKTWESRYGSSWHGEPFHVDHIIPLCTATTIEEVESLFHYTNLRLLTPFDNNSKGKYVREQSLEESPEEWG